MTYWSVVASQRGYTLKAGGYDFRPRSNNLRHLALYSHPHNSPQVDMVSSREYMRDQREERRERQKLKRKTEADSTPNSAHTEQLNNVTRLDKRSIFINRSKPCKFHPVRFHSTYISWDRRLPQPVPPPWRKNRGGRTLIWLPMTTQSASKPVPYMTPSDLILQPPVQKIVLETANE
ncbi:hypothetical protein LXL04_030824 [Taraxacum kok-saghyz]